MTPRATRRTPEAHAAELERRLEAIAGELAHAERELAERARYRAALVRIADAESGVWGTIARDALHPDRRPSA